MSNTNARVTQTDFRFVGVVIEPVPAIFGNRIETRKCLTIFRPEIEYWVRKVGDSGRFLPQES